jgi:hypothetical protein
MEWPEETEYSETESAISLVICPGGDGLIHWYTQYGDNVGEQIESGACSREATISSEYITVQGGHYQETFVDDVYKEIVVGAYKTIN